MSKYILFEWIIPIGFALLSGGLVVLIIEILEWFSRKEDKLDRLKDNLDKEASKQEDDNAGKE